jgi:hypothetical protein
MSVRFPALIGIVAAAALATAMVWQSMSARGSSAPAPLAAAETAELRQLLERETAAREQLAAELADLREVVRELADATAPVGAEIEARLEPRVEPAPPPAPADSSDRSARDGDVARNRFEDLGGGSPMFDVERVVEAGLEATDAARLKERYEAAQLERLYARDRAIRAGRMREMGGQVRAIDRSLREELGEEMYDFMLFGSGEANRIAVEDVYRGSAAESGGLRAGDLIRRYAGQAVFQPRELRRLTSQVELGARVQVQIEREGELLDLTVDGGPLGAPVRAVSRAPKRS